MMSLSMRLGAAAMVVLMTAERGMAFVTTSSSPRSITTTTTISSNTIPSSPFALHKPEMDFRQTTTKTSSTSSSSSSLYMAAQDGEKSSLPFLLDPGTRGGAVFLSLVLFLLPLIAYSVVTSVFGVDEVEAGKWIGVGFTATVSFLWVATYIFRVATKDMTYAKQLKDYENAVIAKRLEELDDDEIQALVEEIERDDF